MPAPNGKHKHTLIPIVRKFDSITAKAVEWLWHGWIPLGKLTILDGDPGLGKSTLLLDLAARISTSAVMPDDSPGIGGQVVILSAEDAEDDTIKPRLTAAMANHERVRAMTAIKGAGKELPIEIPGHIDFIEQEVEKANARLLIIDPLMAFLAGQHSDANKDQEVRRILYQLSKMAERQRFAIIAMRHLNKHTGGKAIYRGNCSIGVIGHARAGLLVAEDPDEPTKRILAVTKCNLAAKPQSLRFTLDPIGDVCRIGWMGTSHYQADQLVQMPPTEAEKEAKADSKSKLESCKELIYALLMDGTNEIKVVKKECYNAGHGHHTVAQAAHKLGLKTDYKQEGDKRTYKWHLP